MHTIIERREVIDVGETNPATEGMQDVKKQRAIELADDIDQKIKDLRSKLGIVLRSDDQAECVPDEGCELNRRMAVHLHDLGTLYDCIEL